MTYLQRLAALSLACALLLTGAAALAQVTTPTPLPPGAFLTPTAPAFVFPTATPASCEPPLALVPGQRLNTRPGINLRSQPDLSSAIVQYLENSTTLVALEGPVCQSGINWWRVRGPSNVSPGWVAEREFFGGRYLIFPVIDPATVCPTPLTLPAGTQTALFNGLRVRAAPGLTGLVLTVAPASAVATVVDGPVCADGFNWWLVDVTVLGLVYRGWVAEGFAGRPFVDEPGEPPAVCSPPLPFTVGSRGFVSYRDFQPKSLRAAPGRDAELLFTLIDGVAFEVIGGPVCADGFNWWHVQIISRPDAVGWIAEGVPGTYWVRGIRARR